MLTLFTRMHCLTPIVQHNTDSLASPWVGGISGGPRGAYSVAISGGYEDDVDLGYAL